MNATLDWKLILNRWRNERALRDLQTDETKGSEDRAKQEDNRTQEERDEVERASIKRRIRDILTMENRLRRESRR